MFTIHIQPVPQIRWLVLLFWVQLSDFFGQDQVTDNTNFIFVNQVTIKSAMVF